MILAHVPVHPSQLDRWRRNVHGHLHTRTLTRAARSPAPAPAGEAAGEGRCGPGGNEPAVESGGVGQQGRPGVLTSGPVTPGDVNGGPLSLASARVAATMTGPPDRAR